MKNLLYCRRMFICMFGILVLGVLGARGMEVAPYIAAISVGLAGANAYEKAKTSTPAPAVYKD